MPADRSPTFFSGTAPLSPIQIPGAKQSQPRLRTSPPRPRRPAGPLTLKSLPRFHPANFPSSHHSSIANTPGTNVNSPQPPVSPRSQQRQLSEAQRQLYLYQRELLASTGRTKAAGPGASPASPRLAPLGSPGPVTPLELEEQDCYLAAGSGSSAYQNGGQRDSYDQAMREEMRRKGESSPKSPPVAASAR